MRKDWSCTLRRIGAFFFSALTLSPAAGLAWSGEPLCALPEIMLDGAGYGAGESDDPSGICEFPRLHVLPSPNFDACSPMSGRESSEDAPWSRHVRWLAPANSRTAGSTKTRC